MYKFFGSFFFLLMVVCSSIFAQNQTPEFEGRQEDPDMDALKKWIRQKRMVTVKEIGGDLSLSGEVRAEMQVFHELKKEQETDNWIKQRGTNSPTGLPTVPFDVEVNFMLDYRADRTWASVKIEYDNDMGQVGGTTNKIALERAYFGARLIDGDTVTFDVELGRRNLGNIFDSKIEFSSLFDGLLVKFSKASEAIGDFYINGGGFVINDKENHFGFVTEMGMLNIGNTGFYTKYSFIDWKEHKYPKGVHWNRYNYLISQLILGYQFSITPINKLFKFYSAALCNHAAKEIALTRDKRYNWGCYIGFSLGQVRRKGDWALDVNYQYVQPQAVPDVDSAGIKRGNSAGIGFFSEHLDGTGAEFTDPSQPVGGCNYQGFQIDFLYALSNNLTWQHSMQWSRNQTKKIGPAFKYCFYEMEFIYAF